MARINIEDSFYRDHRFISLLQLGYKYYEALGLAVGAWSLAQKHYLKTEHRLIPSREWDGSGFEIFEKVGLAERRVDGIYMRGSEEQFAWLTQRSNAGKNSSQRSKTGNGRSTVVQRLGTDVQPLTLTPTLPLSLPQRINSFVVNSTTKNNENNFEEKLNDVQEFDERMKSQEWVNVLKEVELDSRFFKRRISSLKERFRTEKYFKEWVMSVCKNETYQRLKQENKRVECDRYLEAAVKKEIGF